MIVVLLVVLVIVVVLVINVRVTGNMFGSDYIGAIGSSSDTCSVSDKYDSYRKYVW